MLNRIVTAAARLTFVGVLCAFAPAVTAVTDSPTLVAFEIARKKISLQQAVAQIKGKYGGRVLKAEPANLKGRSGYRIRVMNNGRVREFMVDADSGELVKP